MTAAELLAVNELANGVRQRYQIAVFHELNWMSEVWSSCGMLLLCFINWVHVYNS